MKLACSSTAFDVLFRSGGLTQLEWIDLCAQELAADGVVFDVQHFPRTDSDYLAQVKKMCADTGLSVAALRDDALLHAARSRMEPAFEIALGLAAPLIAMTMPPQTAVTWSDTLERLGLATALAKRTNVTLALRNAPKTFAEGTHDMKRVAKEADSAWLRFGPEFSLLDAGSDPEAIVDKVVLVWQQTAQDIEPLRRLLARYRGFVALDAAHGNADVAQIAAMMAAWRSPVAVDRA